MDLHTLLGFLGALAGILAIAGACELLSRALIRLDRTRAMLAQQSTRRAARHADGAHE